MGWGLKILIALILLCLPNGNGIICKRREKSGLGCWSQSMGVGGACRKKEGKGINRYGGKI